MFCNVLVGFDGSPQAYDALSLATALTAANGSLTACCVHHPETVSGRLDPTEPRLDRPGAERCLRRAGELLRGRLATDALVLEGVDAAAMLQHAAREREADLLVLGSSHRGRLGRVALGSAAVEALHDPPCPVAIASFGAHALQGGVRIASIAVGCDVAASRGPELRLAVELASALGAALHIVAVADTRVALMVEYGGASSYPAVLRERRVAAEEGLAAVMADMPAEVSATGEVREGNPAEKLAEASRGVDLLVVGAHHYGPLDRLLGRSVSRALASHSHCPVLAVPRLG